MSPSMLDIPSVREYLEKKLICRADTADKMLANFVWALNRRDLADYGRLLHPDFEFVFQGFDVERFEQDFLDLENRSGIEADKAEARSMRLNRTPGFFINGRYLRGAKP